MKKIFFLCILFFMGIQGVFAGTPTIHSTDAGGSWDSVDTWLEGRIPAVDDIAEINGSVTITTSINISGVSITGSGTLINTVSGDPRDPRQRIIPHIITGDIENNGVFSGTLGGIINVFGNIINTGTFQDIGEINILGYFNNQGSIIRGNRWSIDKYFINTGEIENISSVYVYGNFINLGNINNISDLLISGSINNEGNIINTATFLGLRDLVYDNIKSLILSITGVQETPYNFEYIYISEYLDQKDIFIKILETKPNGERDIVKTICVNIDGCIGNNNETNIAPIIQSITSTQNSIDLGNQKVVDFSINGITDLDEGQILNFSYSLDGGDFISLSSTGVTPIENGNIDFSLNFLDINDGNITIYVKADDGVFDSNIATITLNKNTVPDPIIIQGDFVVAEGETYTIFNGTDVTVEGSFINNGNIEFENIGTGKILVRGNIDNNGNFGFTDLILEGTGSRIIQGNTPIDVNATLYSDITIEGDFIYNGIIDLNGYGLYVDGTKNIKIGGIKGRGLVISKNGKQDKNIINRLVLLQAYNPDFQNNKQLATLYKEKTPISFLNGVGGASIIDNDPSVSILDFEPGKFYLFWENQENIDRYKLFFTGKNPVELSDLYYQYDIDDPEIGVYLWNIVGIDSEGNQVPNGSQYGVDILVNDEYEEEIKLPLPTNLQQYIQSPLLEREEVIVGEKIGKFQSGSGIVLSADIVNDTNNPVKLVISIYSSGTIDPIQTLNTDFSSGSLEKIVPFSGGGNFYWKARTQDAEGNTSDWVEFGNNGLLETDYSIFTGFEPYPHGYKFINNSPDYSILDGSILKNNGIRSKDDGKKWEIMDMVFPLSSFNDNEKKYLDAFESIGLNNEKPTIFNGNCFGLAFTALSQYIDSGYLERKFPIFSDLIGDGYTFDKININSTSNNSNWIGFNDSIKTMLAAQLYQYDLDFINNLRESTQNNTPVDILNEIKNNPTKEYILSFNGETNCNIFGFSCNSVGHAVVPYRVEGNRIYIWDNNYPYSYIDDEGGKINAYDRYIEVNTEDNTFTADGYDRNSFNEIGIVSSSELHRTNLLLPGFNETDTVYTVSGSSDMILIDSEGRKTGFLDGEVYEEIPGANIIQLLNGDISQNKWKQIYLPEKIENLQLQVIGNIQESYDLMIAGGDYYTKLESIETTPGETDTFISSRESIQIDFDDAKVGNYHLLTDDFKQNGTGTIYIDTINITGEPQEYNINWEQVAINSNNSITHKVDSNNDGVYDIETTLPPINFDTIPPITTVTLSGSIENNNEDIFIETVSISLDAIDDEGGVGVKNIYYSFDNSGEYNTYTGSIELNQIGEYTLNYYSVDLNDNIEDTQAILFSITERDLLNAKISGFIYKDKNTNGTKDPKEKEKKNWEVFLDLNNDGELQADEPSYKTKKDGYYEFTGLAFGDYTIVARKYKKKKKKHQKIRKYKKILTTTIFLAKGEEISNINLGTEKVKKETWKKKDNKKQKSSQGKKSLNK